MKYLLIQEFRTKFQLPAIFLSSVIIKTTVVFVYYTRVSKRNGHLFIKMSCCYSGPFVAHDKMCRGITLEK